MQEVAIVKYMEHEFGTDEKNVYTDELSTSDDNLQIKSCGI